MARLRVGLVFGGCSGEHEVSINSAQAVAQAFGAAPNQDKYQVVPFYIHKDGGWQGGDIAQQALATLQPVETVGEVDRWQFPADVASVEVWFPMLHGPNGEDGTVQGLLQLMQVPYVGSGVLAAATGMDKIAMKTVFAAAGLPQVKYAALRREQVWSDPCVYSKLCDRLETDLGYPCFVKPANLGSSVGVAKVRSASELTEALDNAASYDRRLIVEAGVKARELECAVLGNENPQASVVGEITYESDFYDYETKYTSGEAELLIPAPIPDQIRDRVQEMALQSFTAIDAAGLARVDFFYLESTGEVVVNEINTLPGFTALSMYPKLWQATGVSFPQLVDQLVQLALKRHQKS